MELWTEYEGRTIEGVFSLEKLLLPEGRSAFFSTSNGKGDPTVIRLIASHFDEEEILARWRGIEALNHPNIVKLERYGQLILDDTTVVYAVIEPVDANLAEVIRSQRLTVPEARQLASSLASALQVLHSNGFVHEHVEPSNVFAVGEVVKLRGDCIREAPEGEAGLQAKRRDIHDLAVVLLQALTQKQASEVVAGELSVPKPFDQIIRNGMSGLWGEVEIIEALREDSPASKVVVAPAISLTVSPVQSKTSPAVPDMVDAKRSATSSSPTGTSQANLGSLSSRPHVVSEPDEDEDKRSFPKTGLILIGVIAVLLIVWLALHFSHREPANPVPKTAALSSASPAPAPMVTGHSVSSHPAHVKPAAKPSAVPVANTLSNESHLAWRVVAFTYNYRDQAEKKAATIAQKHPELKPEVLSSSGRAPYLVTLGGAMDRDAALAYTQRAKRLGLPRDTYAQNYKTTAP